jgi:two-component system NtrC family response regulator
LGGREEIPIDVRVVCATHQNLKALIADGRFREDLYYRLAEIVVNAPPLRARPGDAALLAHAFLLRFANEYKRPPMTLLPDALNAIEQHPWPGNVRQLENVVKRAVIMAEGTTISAADLELPSAEGGEEPLNLRAVRDTAERAAVLKAIARANGNMSRAAEWLGISRPTLYDLMQRFGLKSST